MHAFSVKDKVRRFYHRPDGLSDSVRLILISKDVSDRNLLNL